MSIIAIPAQISRKRRSAAVVGRHQRIGLLFILPALVLFLLLLVGPLLYALYLSLYTQRLVGGNVFSGLANYTAAFADSEFIHSLLRMLLFMVVQVPIMLGFALVFALLLDSGRLWFPRLFRLGVFVPYAVPSVVGALMWGFLYGPNFGVLGQIGRAVGIGTPNFLGSGLILASIGNVVTWTYTGYNMIILYAALRSVPTELYDAAAVDGAGAFRVALDVKLPLLKPALLLATVFSVIGSFQLFNEPSILGQVAPQSISNSYTPNLYIYNLAFQDQRLNYAAALAFILGFVVFILSFTVMFLARRRSS